MTKGELSSFEHRVIEIATVLDQCDDRFDSDVIDNLSNELEQIIETLNSSIKEVS